MEALGLDVLLNGNNAIRLLGGLWVSVQVALISVALSLPLGLLFGIFMTWKNRFAKIISRIYLEIVRIMPQLVLLFVVFFGATKSLGINLSAEAASVIVFTFWGTGEMDDLVRGALTSVSRHQFESGEALGLTKAQTYVHIVIPQAIRQLVPTSVNLITRMIKTTSLVMMIGIVEVMNVGQQIIDANRIASPNAVFGVYGTILFLYFIVCWPLSMLATHLEKRWSLA